jgi:hypothetical protein
VLAVESNRNVENTPAPKRKSRAIEVTTRTTAVARIRPFHKYMTEWSMAKHRFLRSILVAAALTSGAGLAQPGDVVMIAGEGNNTCARWAQFRLTNSDTSVVIVMWVQGFVTGQNYFATEKKYKVIPAESEDIKLWLDTFCRLNPLGYIVQGALAFIEIKGGPKAQFQWKRP